MHRQEKKEIKQLKGVSAYSLSTLHASDEKSLQCRTSESSVVCASLSRHCCQVSTLFNGIDLAAKFSGFSNSHSVQSFSSFEAVVLQRWNEGGGGVY